MLLDFFLSFVHCAKRSGFDDKMKGKTCFCTYKEILFLKDISSFWRKFFFLIISNFTCSEVFDVSIFMGGGGGVISSFSICQAFYIVFALVFCLASANHPCHRQAFLVHRYKLQLVAANYDKTNARVH